MATLQKDVAPDRDFLFVNKSIEQIDFLTNLRLGMTPSDVCICKYCRHFEVTFNVNAVNVRYTV